MKHEVIYGTILFIDDFTAIVQEVKKLEHVEGVSVEECMDMAEWNSSFYGGDWIIPALYNGTITFDNNQGE
jgi:hypothetical protein